MSRRPPSCPSLQPAGRLLPPNSAPTVGARMTSPPPCRPDVGRCSGVPAPKSATVVSVRRRLPGVVNVAGAPARSARSAALRIRIGRGDPEVVGGVRASSPVRLTECAVTSARRRWRSEPGADDGPVVDARGRRLVGCPGDRGRAVAVRGRRPRSELIGAVRVDRVGRRVAARRGGEDRVLDALDRLAW